MITSERRLIARNHGTAESVGVMIEFTDGSVFVRRWDNEQAKLYENLSLAVEQNKDCTVSSYYDEDEDKKDGDLPSPADAPPLVVPPIPGIDVSVPPLPPAADDETAAGPVDLASPAVFVAQLQELFDDVLTTLVAKNASYGNSVFAPVQVFKGSKLAAIEARINDKITRLVKGEEWADEDSVFDLFGYLAIYIVARRAGLE